MGAILASSACTAPHQPAHSLDLEGELSDSQHQALRAEMRAAASAVRTLWEQSPRVQVRATDDQSQFVRWGGDGDPNVSATTTQAGVVLVGPALLGAQTRARTFVLTHEFTHVLLGVRSRAPRWVAEGAAEYTAFRASELAFVDYAPTLAAQIRSGSEPTAPPADAALAAGSAQLQQSYQLACAWADFLVHREGLSDYRHKVRRAISTGRREGRLWNPESTAHSGFLAHLRRLCGWEAAPRQ